MNIHRLLRSLENGMLWLLLVAHITVYLMLPYFAQQWPDASGLVRDAVILSQLSLLSAWLLLGPGRWFIRLPAILVFVFALYWRFAVNGDWQSSTIVLTLIMSAVVFIFVVVARLRGHSLTRVDGLEPDAAPFRFSMRSLFVLTIVSAVAIWAGQRIALYAAIQEAVPKWVALPSVAIPFAAITLYAIWALLKPGVVWIRALGLIVLAPLLGAIGPYLCARESSWSEVVAWTSVHGGILFLTLIPIRWSGYRVVRKRSEPVAATKSSQPLSVAIATQPTS